MNKELVRKKPMAHVKIFIKDTGQLLGALFSGNKSKNAGVNASH
jgi:hypothetical protein